MAKPSQEASGKGLAQGFIEASQEALGKGLTQGFIEGMLTGILEEDEAWQDTGR